MDLDGDGSITLADVNAMGALADNAITFPRPGDFNRDGELDADDIDLLFAAANEENPAREFDIDGNGSVDRGDVNVWLSRIADRGFGDVNLDGELSFRDFLLLNANFGLTENVGWGNGDLNGDGMVDFGDFLELSFAIRAAG